MDFADALHLASSRLPRGLRRSIGDMIKTAAKTGLAVYEP